MIFVLIGNFSKITYGLTTKNHIMLMYEGYIYQKETQNKSRVTWHCSKKKSMK